MQNRIKTNPLLSILLPSQIYKKCSRVRFRIKSEVVNALKKHYETFLEEDKKRKERNEFIIARLDQLRSSTIPTASHHRMPTMVNMFMSY